MFVVRGGARRSRRPLADDAFVATPEDLHLKSLARDVLRRGPHPDALGPTIVELLSAACDKNGELVTFTRS